MIQHAKSTLDIPEGNHIYLKNCVNLYLLLIYNIMQKFNLLSQDLFELFKFQKS